MVRNGYQRISNGNFVKLLVIPGGKTNQCVEIVTRDRAGKIINTKTRNRRKHE